MRENDLKPCPFCGGEAKILPGAPGLYSAEKPLYHAKCKSCGSSTYGHGRDCAITAWNRRAPPAAVPDGYLDDIAARLWKAEAEDSGTPKSVVSGRTREAFDDQDVELKNRWRKFARAAISAAPAAPNGWQDISTAPKDGTQIILLSANGTRQLGWWSEAASAWAYGGGSWGENITDWMPLPAAPTEAPNE